MRRTASLARPPTARTGWRAPPIRWRGAPPRRSIATGSWPVHRIDAQAVGRGPDRHTVPPPSPVDGLAPGIPLFRLAGPLLRLLRPRLRLNALRLRYVGAPLCLLASLVGGGVCP